MAQDPVETLIAEGGGDLYLGPVGTTLPTDPAATFDVAFHDVGYIHEDGLTITFDPGTVTDYGAWQSAFPIRSAPGAASVTVAGRARQWNIPNLENALGATVDDDGSVARIRVPKAPQIIERAALATWTDGIKDYLAVFPRMRINAAVTLQLARTVMTDIPMEWRALDPGSAVDFIVDIYTTDAAFFAGS